MVCCTTPRRLSLQTLNTIMLNPIPTCPQSFITPVVCPAQPVKVTNINVNVNVNKLKKKETQSVSVSGAPPQ